jgi:acetyl/propionyl-CoA carboxylase alpha subunit
VGADCREHNCVITFLLQMATWCIWANVIALYSAVFQKLVEEAPCPIVSPFWRMKMGAAAIDVALDLDYVGALTVEFFYFPETRIFYFNEINSRLQVEHCVTEMVTGIDIVREQIRIAQGEELSFSQDDIRMTIHAVECRINAEDALRNFIPSPRIINKLRLPQGPGIRIDEGIYEGYDFPLLKLIIPLMGS